MPSLDFIMDGESAAGVADGSPDPWSCSVAVCAHTIVPTIRARVVVTVDFIAFILDVLFVLFLLRYWYSAAAGLKNHSRSFLK